MDANARTDLQADDDDEMNDFIEDDEDKKRKKYQAELDDEDEFEQYR